MSKEIPMTKSETTRATPQIDEAPVSGFGFRHSLDIRHSSFDMVRRRSPEPAGATALDGPAAS
jgi:hypothetical protein